MTTEVEVKVAETIENLGRPLPGERIVAAAVMLRNKEGKEMVLCVDPPGRHHHILHSQLIRDYRRSDGMRAGIGDQGFLTSAKRFVRRRAAETLAITSGQLTKPIIGGELTSEDLW